MVLHYDYFDWLDLGRTALPQHVSSLGPQLVELIVPMQPKAYRLHFHLHHASSFAWPGIEGWSYSESTDFPRASAARFRVTTQHGPVKSTTSDRVYLVLSGNGWFDVDGSRFDVTADDVVIVPKDTPYDYGGRIEVFLVHLPAFDRSAEVRIET